VKRVEWVIMRNHLPNTRIRQVQHFPVIILLRC